MSWYYREPYEAVGDNAGTNTCQSPCYQQVGGRLSSVLQVISQQSTLLYSAPEAEWNYCRPSYRHDYDMETSRQGDYTIRGYLYRPDDSLGYQDGRSYYSRQFPGYRRSYDGYYGRTGVSV